MAFLIRLLGIIRAPFLLLAPACLAPAFATAYVEQGYLDPVAVLLVLAAALSAHIGVNALNEYEDFRSGLDFITVRTPFSGGSGTLIRHPEMAIAALFVAWLALFVTFSIGVYFLLRVGPIVVVPGLLGIAIVVTYTRWINRFPLLCLVVPGAGFGLLFVNLGIVALTGTPSHSGFLLSLPVALLVSNLLLVNQLPDIEADRAVGRNHIAIAWGRGWARRWSLILVSLTYLSVMAGWVSGALPATVMVAAGTLPLAVWMFADLNGIENGDESRLVPAMAKNVLLTLITPLLLAAGVVLGSG